MSYCAVRSGGWRAVVQDVRLRSTAPHDALMRSFIVGALLVLVATPATTQSRWTFSAGPEWIDRVVGGRVRAEYDLTPSLKPFRVRLEFGGYWEPTQNFYATYLDGSSVGGTKQSMDLSVGLSGVVAPLPRARVAPYLSFGVLARQA